MNILDVTLNVSHIIRHDTEQNWTNKNPILLKGEQGYVTDGTHAKMHKTGDGVTNWNDLNFDKAIANGGNADTVGGFTVKSDVPENLEYNLENKVNKNTLFDENQKINTSLFPSEYIFGNYKIIYNQETDSLNILYIG